MSRSVHFTFLLRRFSLLAPLALPGAVFLLGGLTAHAQFSSATDRVLWVGDSWFEIMWNQRILGDALDQFGHDDKNEYNDDPTGGIDPNQTAISGMTAATAADPAQVNYPLRIQNVLTAKPETDVVFISLGGNDMIAGGGFIQGPAFYTPADLYTIAANINTIVQASLAVRHAGRAGQTPPPKALKATAKEMPSSVSSVRLSVVGESARLPPNDMNAKLMLWCMR